MADREHFWRLEHLSDRQLLERLQGVLRTHRCSLAELIAHLGEVEERRLHLAAAHGSMFSYCVQHLGMTEDEACRRIELARLARKFPLLFGELASGRISLSVALLLKPVLTSENHTALFAAARGASLRTVRELLAARFPSPDVPSRIRKLPERPVAHATPATVNDGVGAIPAPLANVFAVHVATPGGAAAATTSPGRVSSPQPLSRSELEHGSSAGVDAQSLLPGSSTSDVPSPAPAQAHLLHYAEPRQRQRIDPLSAERYRIQFTADANLKQKLELARDLMRHSYPSGEFAPIISRAIDLLLQELLHRRFGARRKGPQQRSADPTSQQAPPTNSTALAPTMVAPRPVLVMTPTGATALATTPPTAVPSRAAPRRSGSGNACAAAPPAAAPPVDDPSSHIARAARRAVLERDGLGCCWVDPAGNRCGSTAWLELDHHHPSGKGGNSEPENLRLLCRAHNRFAAERAYGRDHIERAIQARQQGAKRRGQSGRPPSSSPAPA